MITTTKRVSAHCKPGTISKTFEKLKIVLDIGEALGTRESLIAVSYYAAILRKESADQIIKDFKDMLTQNEDTLSRCGLSDELIKRIKDHETI